MWDGVGNFYVSDQYDFRISSFSTMDDKSASRSEQRVKDCDGLRKKIWYCTTRRLVHMYCQLKLLAKKRDEIHTHFRIPFCVTRV